jgi:hypothetical protein
MITVSKIRQSIDKIISSMNEKPKTDPIFEVKRLLRVGGFKIKDTTYDNNGTAHIVLAFSSELKNALKYLNDLNNLPAVIEIVGNTLVVSEK